MSFDAEFRRALKTVGVLNWRTLEESGEAHFLSHYLGALERPLVLDVGANKGDYSLAARAVAPTARILAFEPHPTIFAQLETAVSAAAIETFNIGLGDTNAAAELFDRADKTAGSAHASLYKGVIESIHRKPVVTHAVQIRRLDDFLAEKDIRHVALLKVDTEGHELPVFRGAEQTIRSGRIDAIQFEFNSMNAISRTFFKDFWDFLPEYEFYRLLPTNAIRFKTYNPLLCEIYAFQNIVCVRKPMSLYPNAFEVSTAY